mgnify:FL=1
MVLIAIDKIMEAIENNKQISFRYYSWTPDKEKKYSNEGKQRVVNPWDLCWDNTAYYCMTSTPENPTEARIFRLIKWTKYLLQIKTELLKVLKGLGILILWNLVKSIFLCLMEK